MPNITIYISPGLYDILQERPDINRSELFSTALRKLLKPVQRVANHGQSKTRLYSIWHGMKQRCTNPNASVYQYYGARGIVVCKEWNNFETFYSWAIANGYKAHLTIDRINNNGDYCPDNCRWITQKDQNSNSRNALCVTMNNETHTLTEWSKITGIRMKTISQRLLKDWTVEEALTTPVNKKKSHNR